MKIINILRACREVPYGILLNRLFKIIIAVILFFITVISVSFAQDNYVFGPSILVNDDPVGTSFHSTSSAGQHSIGCMGDTVYLVWSDERIDPRAVYFSRSTDAGNTWSTNIRLSSSNPDLDGATPSLTLDAQGNIYVCYGQYDWSIYNVDVYLTKSTDGGESFSTPLLVNDTTRAAQDMPSIAVDSSGEKVFVAWQDTRNSGVTPNFDIYMAKSTDSGLSFLPSVRVDDTGVVDTSDQESPSIGCTRSGDTVYVVWSDERNRMSNDNLDIYFSRSVDGCASFEPDILVNDTVGTNQSTQGSPSLWISKSGNIYIVWRDNRFGPYQVYFAKSIDAGQTFLGHKRVTDTLDSGGIPPSICSCNDSFICVVWKDARTYSQTGDDIYFSFSTDSGDSFSANVMVNDTLVMEDAWQWGPTICVNESGEVFVAWSDDRYFGGGPGFDVYFAAGQYVGIKEQVCKKKLRDVVQLFPNPFRQMTEIRWQMPDGADSRQKPVVSIKIYDISGRMVKQFDFTTIGLSNQIIWNGKDDRGHLVPSGIYFIKVETENRYLVKKVVKMK